MLRWLIALMLASIAPTLGAVEPVALVTELSGTGTLGSKPQAVALELLQDLAPGARLTLARGAHTVVVHTASGVVYELDGPGSFRVQPTTIEPADKTSRVRRRELPAEIRAYKLDPKVAAQASIVLRGGAEVRLDGPGGVVSEDELRYAIVGALREIRFEVLDEQDAPVLRIDGADGVIDLKGRYAWTSAQGYRVQATGIDARRRPVRLEARFRILPADAAARLRTWQPTSASAATDWIIYALALESLGANASAHGIWQTLHAAR
jgi:hypothetical protein